jgi:DNA invertase Pin-like site-specific DNA recombinase
MPKVRQTSKTLHRQRFKQLRVKTGESVETDAAVAAPIRAAQYVRMSTDHQKYSTLNQSAANHAYAEAHNMEIVRTYADDGKSGLSIRRRDGLKKLLSDIQEDAANFSVVLVYDVSRWGRFQDADESGYYEFHCKKAGIQVIYCGEQFINDGSPLATIIKGIKRAMAGEYSRELSVKVFAGQSRLAQMGFTLGARAAYGMRRMLIDQNGVAKRILNPGEWKSITTDRVTFVPGPSKEIATVRWIFKSFVHEQKTELQIANALNEQGILNAQGHVWTRHGILQVLTHEKYIGNNVWNKCSRKLDAKVACNRPEIWIRAENAFEAIVKRSLFDAAQVIIQSHKLRAVNGRCRRYSDEELVQTLEDLLLEHGYLSRSLLEASACPCANTYERRFGGLTAAFERVGFAPQYGVRRSQITAAGRPRGLSAEEMWGGLRRLWKDRGRLTRDIVNESKAVPHHAAYIKQFGGLSYAYKLIGYVPKPVRVRPIGHRLWSDDAILDHLRELWRKHGHLSYDIVCAAEFGPSRNTIINRFGGMRPAYRLIGFKSKRFRPQDLTDDQMLYSLWQSWRKHGRINQAMIVQTKEIPSLHCYVKRFGSITKAYERIGYEVDRRPHCRRGNPHKDRRKSRTHRRSVQKSKRN